MEYKEQISESMKTLNVYKPEFDQTIEILANILTDLQKAERKFTREGRKFTLEHTNKFGATNESKNPLYSQIENLRQSALQYLKELGLTAAGFKKLNDEGLREKGETKLNQVMRLLG